MEDNTIKLDLSQFQDGNKPEVAPVEQTGQAQEAPQVDTPIEPVLEMQEDKPAPQINEDGDYVLNLKPEADAIQNTEAEKVPVQPEASSSEEIRDPQPEELETLQLITEEETQAVNETITTDKEVPQEVSQPSTDTPDGVTKLIEFMKDTGLDGQEAFKAYSDLNVNPDEMDQRTLMKDFYKATKPFLNDSQIEQQLNKKYSYNAETASPDEIEDKNIALQEELYKAKQFVTERKEKYYTDLKLRKSESLPPEAQEAVSFYDEYRVQQENQNAKRSTIKTQIENVFTEDFKGFDFKVGDDTYRYKIADVAKQKEKHADLDGVFKTDFAEDGSLKDPMAYNKKMFAAQNIDKIATHFMELGRALQIKESAMSAKNIKMDARSDNSNVTTPSGQSIRVVSGDSKQSFKTKMKIKGWN